MKTFLLRMFSIDVLIDFVVAYLASTVKNPTSPEATRLRYIVAKLNKATSDFLVQVNRASFSNENQ